MVKQNKKTSSHQKASQTPAPVIARKNEKSIPVVTCFVLSDGGPVTQSSLSQNPLITG